MAQLASQLRQQLVDNITIVVLEWQRRRPLGQWLSTWPANPQGPLPATWKAWFSETVTQARTSDGEAVKPATVATTGRWPQVWKVNEGQLVRSFEQIQQ